MTNPREQLEDAVAGSDSVQAQRRLYARKYRDYLTAELQKMWEGTWTIDELRNLIATIGDPTRRETYFFVVHAYMSGRGAPDPLKSNVFREALELDILADAHEILNRAGYGDLLSALSWRTGAFRSPRDFTETRAESLGDLFTDE
jgi:hypothetical protein